MYDMALRHTRIWVGKPRFLRITRMTRFFVCTDCCWIVFFFWGGGEMRGVGKLRKIGAEKFVLFVGCWGLGGVFLWEVIRDPFWRLRC